MLLSNLFMSMQVEHSEPLGGGRQRANYDTGECQ